MKIYISTDLEGISGVCVFEQTRDRTSPHYEHARHLLMADISAAVQGCLDGGAKEIVVSDGHGGGFNFVPDEMHPGALYFTGVDRPGTACAFDDSFDGAILLGYHAMNGTATGVLHHTQSSKAECKYWYNGRESGEIAQSAIVFGHFGVPVVMVTGDDATCAEARDFLGKEVVTVSVKRGYSRQCAVLVPPQRAHKMIRAGAKKAMRHVKKCKPYKIDFPAEGRLQLGTKELADQKKPNLSKRVDDVTFVATFESPLDIYKF